MSEHPLLQRAAQPTRDRLEKLAKNVPAEIRPLLNMLGVHFCDSKYTMTRIGREAEATEWHVKLFGRELGMTPSDLRRECRMETTSLLLRDTSLGIDEIACLVGYKGKRGLEKLFEALVGLTPSELRLRLCRLGREDQQLLEVLFSWYFRVRYYRGDLEDAEFRNFQLFLESRFDPTEEEIHN